MFLQLENFLTAAEVQTIADIGRQVKFIDGKVSNPHNLSKDNVVGDGADPLARQAAQIALGAFQRHEEVQSFVLPARVAVPQLARYEVGMQYGAHIDSAFMQVGTQPLRADVSCTIFIASPGDYQGGELVIHQGTGASAIKGPAGSAIFYPSTHVHQVNPVTAGARLVMITFIQSQIPDERQRELWYALNEVRALEGLKMDRRNRTRLEFALANLLRMWSR
jgi:PKHD-type hydroxylase